MIAIWTLLAQLLFFHVGAVQTNIEYAKSSSSFTSCDTVCSGVSKSCIGPGSMSLNCGVTCTSGNCACSVDNTNYWVYGGGYCWSSEFGYSFSCSSAPNTQVCCQCATVYNIAPTATIPSTQTISQNTSWTISSGISVADSDAGSGTLTITMTVSDSGTFTVGSSGSGATVTNDGTSSVTIQGSLTQLNAALPNSVVHPTENFVGNMTVGMSINDNGNSDGAAQTGSGSAIVIVIGA
eukprot:jgi/Bigna1/138268/aug1.44_g12976